MIYFNLLIFAFSLIIGAVAVPIFYNMLRKSELVALNYKNEEIPIGMGLVFIICQTLICFFAAIYLNYTVIYTFGYIIFMLLIGLIGFIDDTVGEKDIKGLKGHIFAMLKGKLTTGGLKALIGFGSAFAFSLIISKSFIEVLLNTMIIALFTNLINLFDLRPGRACKVFIIFSILLISFQAIKGYNYIIYSALALIAIYIPIDLKARGMLGDVGSNALGITLGIFCVISQGYFAKITFLVILVIFHILAEIYSFTKIIENNRFLKFIDNLGR